MIPGYDDWKTTPPDDQVPVILCDCCGCALYEGDYFYDIIVMQVYTKDLLYILVMTYIHMCAITMVMFGVDGKIL